jgi:hypothetical protein
MDNTVPINPTFMPQKELLGEITMLAVTSGRYALLNEKQQEFADTCERQWRYRTLSQPARILAESTLRALRG